MNKKLLAVTLTAAAILGVTAQAEAACPKPPQILPNVTVANDTDNTDDFARKVKFIQKIFPAAPVDFIEYVLDLCEGKLFEACLYISRII